MCFFAAALDCTWARNTNPARSFARAESNEIPMSTCRLVGNLAAVLVWFLWLRWGHIRVLASVLRAFDKANKPASWLSWLSKTWPTLFVSGTVGRAIRDFQQFKMRDAQNADVAATAVTAARKRDRETSARRTERGRSLRQNHARGDFGHPAGSCQW